MRAGDKGFMEAQRAKRLGDRLAPKSHAERTTEAMRQRVYASSWPIVDTTAGPATSSAAAPVEARAENAADDAAEDASAAVPIGPPPMLPSVAEPSDDGSNEGEVMGAVGVSEDGEVKLYILEALPDSGLQQVGPLATSAHSLHIHVAADTCPA